MTAALVPPGCAVADIGTDHARLPVHLVREGISPRVIASDVAEGPLRNARETVQRAGLQDKIELRLSNGFREFAPEDASCWVMAGMGGTLMARLLEAAPWLQAPGTVLVAQPMRHADDLRAWLITHGFAIEIEAVCMDANRPYMALRAAYNAQLTVQRSCHDRREDNGQLGAGYIYYGELIHNPDPIAKKILSNELRLLEKKILNYQLSTVNSKKEALDDFRARYLQLH